MIRNLCTSAVLLLCTAALMACSVNPATGRAQFRLLPAAQVAAMGDQAKPDLINEYGGEVESAELRSYIDRVGRDLVVHVEPQYEDINWTFTVLDTNVINAFALPGGHVFITKGLLQHFENEGQVAGVLGHEIGHVTGRHIDERISQAYAAEFGLGLLGRATESELAVLAGQLFATGYTLSFGRSQESEADKLGVRYMVRAGYDPQGMLQVLQVLDEAAAGAQPPEFLSTHPHPSTRIETVTGLIEKDYAHTQDNPEYGLYRSRFESEARPHLGSPQTAMPMPANGCFCGGHPAPAAEESRQAGHFTPVRSPEG